MKNMYKKSLAFTLAEVLVALTIIGVVAALTVTNVMVNTNAAHAKTALKKAVASLNQVILSNVAEDGFDCAETIGIDEQSLYSIIERRLGGRLVTANPTTDDRWPIYANFIAYPGDVSQTNNANAPVIANDEVVLPSAETTAFSTRYYNLADGMTLILPPNLASCGQPRLMNSGGIPTMFTDSINAACVGFLDINGSKGPNQVIGCEAKPDDIANEQNEYIVMPVGETKTCRMREKSITDVYPIVFFNDRVFPATYASMTVYMEAEQAD